MASARGRGCVGAAAAAVCRCVGYAAAAVVPTPRGPPLKVAMQGLCGTAVVEPDLGGHLGDDGHEHVDALQWGGVVVRVSVGTLAHFNCRVQQKCWKGVGRGGCKGERGHPCTL